MRQVVFGEIVVVLGDVPPSASASSMGMGMGNGHGNVIIIKIKINWVIVVGGLSVLGGLFFFGFVFEIYNGPFHRIACSLTKSKIVSDQYTGVVWWRGGVQTKQFIISFC
jgi:hypothetical protein